MIKQLAVGFLDGVNPIEADRWYFRYHYKECLRFFGPWLRRYETYRTMQPPVDAPQFGIRGGRMTELWYDSLESFIEAKPFDRPYTRSNFTSPATSAPRAAGLIIPAMPTEDFLGKEPTPEELTILRWVCIFKYPNGVSLEDGENWFLNTFSQELKQQHGIRKFVSYRAVDRSPMVTPWQRMMELWYEDFESWQRANLNSPTKYSLPPWSGSYPFVDIASCFVGNKPDVDFLRDNPTIP